MTRGVLLGHTAPPQRAGVGSACRQQPILRSQLIFSATFAGVTVGEWWGRLEQELNFLQNAGHLVGPNSSRNKAGFYRADTVIRYSDEVGRMIGARLVSCDDTGDYLCAGRFTSACSASRLYLSGVGGL